MLALCFEITNDTINLKSVEGETVELDSKVLSQIEKIRFAQYFPLLSSSHVLCRAKNANKKNLKLIVIGIDKSQKNKRWKDFKVPSDVKQAIIYTHDLDGSLKRFFLPS